LAKTEIVLTSKWWQIGTYILLKSNRKSDTASSFMWFPPYFYFRFGRSASWASFIAAFGRTLQVTVRPMLRTILLSILSVTLVYCGQTVGWIRMPLGTEVGLDPGDIVLDGDPTQLPPPKGAQQPPLFGPCLFWPNGSQAAEVLFDFQSKTERFVTCDLDL